MTEAVLPTGERVTVVGHAEGPEYLSMPFDAGRSADVIRGKPRQGAKVTQVRYEDGRREWWPARQVRRDHAERVGQAVEDFMRRRG